MIRSVVAGLTCLCVMVAACLLGCDSAKRPAKTNTASEAPRVEPASESAVQSADQAAGDADASDATPPSNRDGELTLADQLIERGQLDQAAALLRRLLVADPEDVEVLFMLANLDANQGNLAAAVDLLDAIPRDHPEAGIPSLGQSADWCMELGRYDEAEKRYREVLRRVPDAFPARRQLALLLNRQGRRHEAAAEVRELCKLGNVRQDELHSLIMLSHAMYDDPNATADNSQGVVYTPIGPGGVARKLFTDGKFGEAADALESMVDGGTAPAALVALYGRAVVESQDDQRFLRWLSSVDDDTREMADYWAAIGTYLISQRRFEEATHALLEAAERDPTDMNSFGRLGQTLLTLGDAEASQRWLDRWDEMNELVKANNRVSETNPPDPDRIAELIDWLDALNRPLEAVLWSSIADHLRGASEQKFAANNDRLKQLVAEDAGFASEQERLCDVDPQKYPLPSIEELKSNVVALSSPGKQRSDSPTPASFENVASKVGLNHAYQVAAQPQTEGFAIYQTYGGAVAVLDFDLDGRSDLYFAQGGSDPPAFQGPLSNQIVSRRAAKRYGRSQSGLHDARCDRSVARRRIIATRWG